MVTVTKRYAELARIAPEGRICTFHLYHPDQQATMESCPRCFVVEDICGCNYESTCEICHPEQFKEVGK